MKKLLVVLCTVFLLFGLSGALYATPMPLDGTWIVLDEFTDDEGFFIGSWDWTSTSSVQFDITDLYVVTDAFEVYDNGTLVLTTPDLPDYPSGSDPYGGDWTNDPDIAWATSSFSKGSIVFGAGSHEITIKDYSIPVGFSDATVAFRAAPVPEPATIALLSFGLIGLAGASRKKFRK